MKGLSMLRPCCSWLILLFVSIFVLSACASSNDITSSSSAGINVVAAENFYGDIVKQLGGDHVTVTNILSDPQVDPHAYESSVQNGIAVTRAQLVIKNGGGYDSWMDKLLSASPNSNRIVLTAFDLAPTKLTDNEHVWYGIENIKPIAQAITDALKRLNPAKASMFDKNKQRFDGSLAQVIKKMDEIKAKYSGTSVGLTETIFLYQSRPLGLNVLTPFAFQKAVAEGQDPPADAVATTNNQVSRREIKILVYNEQTATPLTANLQSEAKKQGIPLVAITETMPKTKTYQGWMLDQLTNLEQTLQRSK